MQQERSKPKKSVEALRRLLRHAAPRNVVRALVKMHPADMAKLLTALSSIERNRLVELLFQAHRAGVTLSELPEDILRDVLDDVPDEKLVRIMTRMPVDDRLVAFEILPSSRQDTIVELLPDEVREEITRFLRYPPDSAGRNATDQYLSFRQDETVGEVTHFLRTDLSAPEMLNYIYVVDDTNHLMGVLSLRALIVAHDETPLKEIMTAELITVPAEMDQEEVARLVARYNLIGVPVIDIEGSMLGVVTVDDVIDILEEEFTEDIYGIAGLDEEDRVNSPATRSLRKRVPWMMVNLFTALAAASVIGLFEDTIAQLSFLAIFLPVVGGMSGSTAIQTLTVITRGMALGELEVGKGVRAVLKEMTVGMGIGIIVGLVAGAVSFAWKGNPWLGAVLWASMFINMIVAGFIGSAVPLTLKKLKLDPAMGSGVLITTTVDMVGFFVFLALAQLAMPYLESMAGG